MSPLPTLSSFIGREAEIEQIAPLILTHRLVTLTGSGGAGKTRLAFEVAARLTTEFDDGICAVELAPITDPELVPRIVAQALGLVEPAEASLSEQLAAYLEQRGLLLVLDNCEHLVDACAAFVAALLSHCCTDLRILATSREPLGVPGEVAWRVPPLSAPRPEVSHLDLAALARFDALRLFVRRAQEADPGFIVAPPDLPVLAAICNRLDGMPLAIELAAARVKVLTLAQIAARLDDALGLLGGGPRTAPTRQRTIRATISWSYHLLDEQAAKVLCRLSVFSRGWDMEAAAAVCAGLVDGPEVLLDVMVQLIDKSLVVAQPDGAAMRYHLQEVVRQFAAEQLGSRGETETTRELHLAYYVALAEQAKPELRSARLVEWLARLDSEYDNLRAALAFVLERAPGSARFTESALRLAIALEPYWRFRGYCAEGQAALAKGAAAAAALTAHDVPMAVLRATALTAQAYLRWYDPRPSPWQPLVDETIDLWRAIGRSQAQPAAVENLRGLAAALWILGNWHWCLGDPDTARGPLAESLALFRAAGDELGEADVLTTTGSTWMGADNGLMRRLEQQALAIYQKHGDTFATGRPYYALAGLCTVEGDYNEARMLYERVLADAQRLENKHSISTVMLMLTRLARRAGEMDSALRYHSEGVRISHDIDLELIDQFINLAYLTLAQGDPRQAALYAWQTLDSYRQAHDDLAIASVLIWCAHFKRATGRQREGVQLLAAAEAFCQRIGRDLYYFDRPDRDRVLQQLKSEVPAPDFAAAWAEGLELSTDEALGLGFGEPGDLPARPARALTPLRAARERFGGLTAREREIAACVARGRSNREIAAELVVSERTVEAHIGNVLSKLEFTSRTQIATWALQNGLVQHAAATPG